MIEKMVFNNSLFRKDLITKRVIMLDLTMEDAAKEIGISKATLSRLEHSKIPDIETFFKCVNWLKVRPNKYITK